ncbi:MAG: squalene--hopene cyclase [Phycisphaerales bacterium]|nr:squalene--hopene cyclase [Phycisphaerales bacterium]
MSTPSTASSLSKQDRDRHAHHLSRAVDALLSLQQPDGHWCAELQGDSILESEYILMKFILGQERQPMADGRDGWTTLLKITESMRAQQRPDGGWGQYPGSGVDLSATVKAYFVLKLMGDDPDADHMQAARRCVREHGGAEHVNTFTNFYLACLGQVPWSAVPSIPPEIMLLPSWSYFHLTKVAAWTRTMIVPLSLVVTLRPTRTLPRAVSIDELYIDERERGRLGRTVAAPVFWSAFFGIADKTLKAMHHLGGTPVRRLAIRRAEEWILHRAGQDTPAPTDGLGAIFPPMVYLQIAFMALGYQRDHPVIHRAERELDAFFIEEEDSIRIQPCFSPVWDTGIATYALNDCGRTVQDEAVARAAKWLRAKECTFRGDWAVNVNGPFETCGWAFEYHNAWYPDVDDTAMVSMALMRSGGPLNHEAAARGVEWIFAMQNDDGGWAAFDRTKNRQILEYIPFADHNAMQDPSCPDITGRVLECLSWNGYDIHDPRVQRAIEYVKAQQEREGCWFGRWGVNYIYGTWQSVIGPIRVGIDPATPWIVRAGEWIKSIQKPDGSFGESANSYEDPATKGIGPSTASQTAWSAMILQEIYGADDPDLKRAIDWLCDTQLTEAQASDPTKNPDNDPAGSWHEPWFTGTGFPKVFYLRYHLYRLYFPVMAMGRYLSAHGVRQSDHKVVKVLPKVEV